MHVRMIVYPVGERQQRKWVPRGEMNTEDRVKSNYPRQDAKGSWSQTNRIAPPKLYVALPNSLCPSLFNSLNLYQPQTKLSKVSTNGKMHTDIATRAFIVALKASGGKSSTEIAALTGLSKRLVNLIYARAIERGFDPNVIPFHIEDAYLTDLPRSGRPVKATDEASDQVITQVQRDRYGREKTCADIAGELSLDGIDISAKTVWRILQESWVQQDQTNEEAWVDNQDEEGTA